MNLTEDSMTAVIGAVPDAVLILDRRERIVLANAAADALFGGRVTGRLMTDFLRHPEFHEALSEAMAGVGPGTARLGQAGTPPRGPFAAHVMPLPDGAGAAVALIDCSAVEQATLARRDFVANVSHELRTPLTALAGFIETLQGAARDDAAGRERFLAIMAEEAGRMIRLVDDLLSLSRVEAEEHRPPTGSVDLERILAGVLAGQSGMAAQAGVALALDNRARQSGRPVLVNGDPDQLTQVFLNLVENALKYGASGGTVTVVLDTVASDARLRGPAVAVSVIDRGEGIAPEHLPRLTERFYRVDSHRSRALGGTGLGLAIVKHIVNRHRGRLAIESLAGQGSTFTVVLPSATPPALS